MNYQRIYKPFKSEYKNIKSIIFDDSDRNHFLQAVMSKREHGRNLRNLIRHFIYEILDMKLNMDEKKFIFENEFFFNDHYLFLITTMINLISFRNYIKLQFFNEIKETVVKRRNSIEVF